MIEGLEDLEPSPRETSEESVARRARLFAQANASLALEGMRVDAADLAIQSKVAAGELTAEEAVAIYLERARGGQ